MNTGKKDDRERELDSFLEKARESKRRGSDSDEWEGTPQDSRPRSAVWSLGLIVGVVVIAVILFLAVKEIKGLKNIGDGSGKMLEKSNLLAGNSALKIDQGKYQAVFLTNGQVYFGKINSHDSSYIELIDIFYLQVKPVLQQGDENNQDKKQQEQKTELSLVKLGNELHGPMDRMMINKDQVVFVEDLKDDGKVTDAIKRYAQGQQK